MKFTRHFVVLLVFTFFAASAHAATVTLTPSKAGSDATFALPVTLDAGADDLNALEGSIRVPEGITIESIETNGSLFTVFASGPAFSLSSRTIEFTGGAPGGLKQKTGLVFTIRAHADTEGTYEFTPVSITGYKNDGKGTSVPVSITPASVTVGAKGSASTAPSSSEPSPLVAEIGKDDSLFGGRWFVAFYGGNVSEYSVKEGWFGAETKASRYYVLKDQNRTSTIRVLAITPSGQKISVKLPAENPWPERGLIALIILIPCAFVFFLWRILNKRRITP